ncbi:MAG: hypothetical protein U0871_12050 [Gemmataceae bacterium]
MPTAQRVRRWRRCLPRFTSPAPVATSAAELAAVLAPDAAAVLAAAGPIGVGAKLYGRPPKGLRDRLPEELLDALEDAGLPAMSWVEGGPWLAVHVYCGREATGRSSVPVEVELFLSVPAEVTVPATRRKPAATRPGRRTLARMRTKWRFLKRELGWVPGCITTAWIDVLGDLLARQRASAASPVPSA